MWRIIQSLTGGRSPLSIESSKEEALAGNKDEVLSLTEADASEPGSKAAPDLVGSSAQDARRIAKLSDLRLVVEDRQSSGGLWGRVLAQEPEPGSSLMAGDAISIAIGSKPHVAVPDVRGGEEIESLAILREVGLVPDRRATRRSDSVPHGHIIRTRPRSGASVPVGTRVAFIVAAPSRPRGSHARRETRRVRVQRLPGEAFLSLPTRGE